MASIKDKAAASKAFEASVDYDPPRSVSPVLARCIHIGGYDTRAFGVAILSLVQQGFLDMRTGADGDITLSPRDSVWPPRSKAAGWLLAELVGKGDFAIGRENYVRLQELRRGHAERLAVETRHGAGTGGLFIMAGFGLVVCLSIMVAALVARAPVGVSALTVLTPFWPVPVLAVGGLWLWRRLLMRRKAKICPDREEMERFYRYIKVAMADRLNPRFAADGAYKMHDPDTVFVAAFGLPNAWADPLVHRLESLLPCTPAGTDLNSAVERSALTEKRGFAPRKQPDLWDPAGIGFWLFFGD